MSADVQADRPAVPAAQLRGHAPGPVHIVRFTSDGRYCLTGAADRTVRLWNPTRADPAWRPPAARGGGAGTSGSFVSAQEYYGGGGGGGGAGDGRDELPSSLPMMSYADGHMHPVHAVGTNPSSTVLLSATDKTLLATDMVTAQNRCRFWGHSARIECVCSVGEEIYATSSYDSTVKLWDARSRSREPLATLAEAKDAVTCVRATVHAPQLVTSSVDGKVRTYDMRTAQVITEDAVRPVTHFSLTADELTIAASCLDDVIRVWDCPDAYDVAGGRKRVRTKLHSHHKCERFRVECDVTSDDAHCVSGSECGNVAVYPLGDGGAGGTPPATVLRRHEGPTCSVAACPDGGRPWLVVSASYDGTAVVWASEAQYDSVR